MNALAEKAPLDVAKVKIGFIIAPCFIVSLSKCCINPNVEKQETLSRHMCAPLETAKLPI